MIFLVGSIQQNSSATLLTSYSICFLSMQGILQSQGRILKKMRFMPSSLSSNSHRLLTALVDSRHKKVYRVKNCITDIDPEREKEQKEKVFILEYPLLLAVLQIFFLFLPPCTLGFNFFQMCRLRVKQSEPMNFSIGRRRKSIASIHKLYAGSANFHLVSQRMHLRR